MGKMGGAMVLTPYATVHAVQPSRKRIGLIKTDRGNYGRFAYDYLCKIYGRSTARLTFVISCMSPSRSHGMYNRVTAIPVYRAETFGSCNYRERLSSQVLIDCLWLFSTSFCVMMICSNSSFGLVLRCMFWCVLPIFNPPCQ